MTALTFVDSHNMVAYLEKSEDNANFVEIVDFLNASPIRYALNVSSIVYVSYIKQFWSTAKTKTVNNETQICAKVNGKTIVITESFVRRDLHFNDEDSIACLTNTEIFKNLELMGSKSTAWNEFGTNIASVVICLANKQKINFSILIFDAVFNDEYDTPSHTKKVFANMRRKGKDFSGTVTPLFATMLIQPQEDVGEGSGQPTEPQHTPTTASPSHVEPIPTIASSSHPKKTKRNATEISQSSGPTTLVADETVHEERGDSVESVATTATSLDAEQGSGNINRTQSTAIPNVPFPQEIGSGGVTTPRNDEERIELKELMDMCTKLSDRVLDLENVKDAQALEIKKLKKRVKKLENKKRSRTPQLKRRLFKVRIESSAEKSLGDQEDASKKERNEIDQDKGISWFQEDAETQGRYSHDTEINTASTSITTASINITTVEPVITASVPIATVGVSVSTTEPSTPPTTTFIEDEDLTISQTLMKMRSVKSKEKSKEKGVSSETAIRPIVPPQQQLDPKDKGKGIMQELKKPVKVKGKDQIEYDVDMTKRLQAKLDEEVRLEREREKEASNVALIE
ncbi:hypothetical protein Tco_1062120 [Tanacetum coccineum]